MLNGFTLLLLASLSVHNSSVNQDPEKEVINFAKDAIKVIRAKNVEAFMEIADVDWWDGGESFFKKRQDLKQEWHNLFQDELFQPKHQELSIRKAIPYRDIGDGGMMWKEQIDKVLQRSDWIVIVDGPIDFLFLVSRRHAKLKLVGISSAWMMSAMPKNVRTCAKQFLFAAAKSNYVGAKKLTDVPWLDNRVVSNQVDVEHWWRSRFSTKRILPHNAKLMAVTPAPYEIVTSNRFAYLRNQIMKVLKKGDWVTGITAYGRDIVLLVGRRENGFRVVGSFSLKRLPH